MSSSFWQITEGKESDRVEAARREAAAAELASLRRRGFVVYEWDALAEAGDDFLADADGRLWRVQVGQPMEGWDPSVHRVALGRGYLRPPREGEPPTLAELEKRQAAEEAQRVEATRKARADFAARKASATPVTATHLAGRRSMTLRQAAETVEDAAGSLEVRGGRLIVRLPQDAPRSALDAAELLYRAEAVVADAVKGKRELPDAEVSGGGALLA